MFSGKNGNKDIRDRVEEIADDISGNLQDFGKDFGREARDSAEDLKKNVVKQLYDSAKSMRREARQRGARGDALHNIDGMAKGLERAATYLKWHSVEDMGDEIGDAAERTVKQNPMQILLVVFAIGLVLGLLLRGGGDHQHSQDVMG